MEAGDTWLLVDLGNTRAKWRHVVDGEASPVTALTHAAFAERSPGAGLFRDDITCVMLSNVAGKPAEARLRDLLALHHPAATVYRLDAGTPRAELVNGYRDPSRLGSDRWAAMLGAVALHPDRHLLVCNFGTATTIDLVVRAGGGRAARFVGGLILPGADTMRRSLARDTAQLPLAAGSAVDFADNTDDAIAGGVVTAQVASVELSVERALSRLGGMPETLLCCISGGGGTAIQAPLSTALARSGVKLVAIDDLVLRGLERVARDLVMVRSS